MLIVINRSYTVETAVASGSKALRAVREGHPEGQRLLSSLAAASLSRRSPYVPEPRP